MTLLMGPLVYARYSSCCSCCRGALVIVDELGRGTSTCDGFGIAWAVADRLVSSGTCSTAVNLCIIASTRIIETVEIKHVLKAVVVISIDSSCGAICVLVPSHTAGCLCLFATHFHELTEMEQGKNGNGVQNLHVTAEADSASNKLTMLYKVARWSALIDVQKVTKGRQWYIPLREPLHKGKSTTQKQADTIHELESLPDQRLKSVLTPYQQNVISTIRELESQLPAPQVEKGSCDRSFGIHVARIANFPAHVVSEAESLATALDSGELQSRSSLDEGRSKATTATGQPSVSCEAEVGDEKTALSTGSKRNISDVGSVEHLQGEGAADKRP